MASLFCLFKFRSHCPNQGLALVNPAFAEKVSFHLVHKACAINQVKPHVMDISIDEKTSQHIEEKQAIAKAAQTLIKPDDAIILASGSTVTAFAEKLEPNGMINVVTPSLGIAVLMHSRSNAKVFILGGALYKNSFSVRGEYAVEGLKTPAAQSFTSAATALTSLQA